MKRAWRILLIVGACAVLAIVMALVWPGEREPEYKGRKLSEWILAAVIARGQPPDEAKRIEAVQHIGTNALPQLLKWIEGSEFVRPISKLDKIAIRVMTKATARSWLDYRSRKFYRAVGAVWAFEVLGTNASPAVPELVRLSHSTNGWVAALASDALTRIKKKAPPPPGDYTKDPKAAAWAHWTNDAGKLQPPTTNSH